MRRRPWNESEYDSMWISRDWASDESTPDPERSVAIASFFMASAPIASDSPTVVGVVEIELAFELLLETDSPLAAAFAACSRVMRGQLDGPRLRARR